MKKFFEEFKAFVMRGNVMDMAVGVIVGGAFGAITTSLVSNVVTPLLAVLFNSPNPDALNITLRAADEAAGIEEAALRYGNFIQNIVSFLLIAVVIFLMVKGMNKLRRKKEEPAPAPAPDPEPSEEVKLLTEIRDALKK